jgi:hypothetical protein
MVDRMTEMERAVLMWMWRQPGHTVILGSDKGISAADYLCREGIAEKFSDGYYTLTSKGLKVAEEEAALEALAE